MTELMRSWTRRGWGNPTPRWGESIPRLWADTELHFYRREVAGNGIGGFNAGVPGDLLVIWAHVEIEEVLYGRDLIASEGLTTLERRRYALYFAVPAVAEATPRKGDRVWFIDALGTRVDLAVRGVDTPENVGDHIEVTTEDYL